MEQLTPTRLKEVLEQPHAVIKYGAAWCKACVSVQPTLESVAQQTDIPFYEVDIDAEPTLAAAARIKAIPMTVFYKNGRPVQFVYGDATEDAIKLKLNLLKR